MSTPKFCASCGNPLGENEKFCGKCGTPVAAAPAAEPAPAPAPEPAPAPVPEPAPEPVPAPVPEPVYQAVPPEVPQYDAGNANSSPAAAAGKNIAAAIGKHKVPIIIGCVALAAIIAGIIILLNLTKYQKIDAKDIFKVSFKGLNTKGTAVAFLDCSEADPYLYDVERDEDGNVIEKEYSKYFSDAKKDLLKAYDKASDIDEAKDMKDALLSKKKGEYKIKAKLDKSENLSNGDKVNVTVEFDEEELLEAKIKLENTEFEVEVSGLIEAEALDVFEGFEVKFTGQNENGKIEYDDTNSKYPFITYYMSEGSTWDVKNGDKIVFTANISSGKVENYNYLDPDDYNGGCYFTYNGKTYVVSEGSPKKEYTVSGLAEPQKVDVFKDIKFRTQGASPYLKITGVITDDCDSVVKDNVNFYVDDSSATYKVGDTFKIKAYPYSNFKAEGYVPDGEPDSDGYYWKEYTVDDSYGHYITAAAFTEDDRTKIAAKLQETIDKFKTDYVGRSNIGGVSLGGDVKSFGTEKFTTAYVILPNGFEDGTSTDYNKNVLYYIITMPATVEVTEDDETKEVTKDLILAYKLTNACINAAGEADFGSFITTIVSDDVKTVFEQKISKEEGKITELKAGGAPAEESKPDESKPEESEPEESEPEESEPEGSEPEEE